MKEKANQEAPAIDGAFLSVLQNHRRGGALSDLAAAMREVTEAVLETGKGGAVTLKFKVLPAATSGAMIVEDEIKTTLPRTKPQGSVFFADHSGNLLREDPNQHQLPLRTVEAAQPEVPLKHVGAA